MSGVCPIECKMFSPPMVYSLRRWPKFPFISGLVFWGKRSQLQRNIDVPTAASCSDRSPTLPMFAQPLEQIIDVSLWFRFEFQCVMRVRVFNDPLFPSGDAIDIGPGPRIVDDAILA